MANKGQSQYGSFEIGSIEHVTSFMEKKIARGDTKYKVDRIRIDFFDLMRKFETQLTQSIREIMIARGVDKSADLVKSVDVGYQQDTFQILANDYYQYVSKGRKAKARKVPVEALIQWIKDNGIGYRGSINSAAFAIQQGIYKKGIKGKLYEESVIDFSSEIISEVAAAGIQYGTLKGMINQYQVFSNNEWVNIVVRVDNE